MPFSGHSYIVVIPLSLKSLYLESGGFHSCFPTGMSKKKCSRGQMDTVILSSLEIPTTNGRNGFSLMQLILNHLVQQLA